MPGRPALALAAGLAEALSAIHAASVVHCDLKPANVLLSQDGPRVIDFGISRAAEPVSATGPGLMAGSPGFMSPEQAMEEEVGPPSDVFSLGAVLAFAVTGRGPFGEGSRPELAYRLVYCQPDLDLVPAGLRPLIEPCLARDPSQRPTAGALLAEVAAMQPATGWLPDLALGAFTEYCASSPVLAASFPAAATSATGRSLPAARGLPARGLPDAGLPDPGLPDAGLPDPGLPDAGRPPSGGVRNSRRRLWRSLAVAGVLVASAAVSLALSGAARHLSAGPSGPKAAAIRAAPGPVPADIIPAVRTFTLPGQGASSSSSPSSPSPASASPTARASATPSPSPSTAAAALVPRITSAGTYQKGVWVYFDVHYADPGHDALGFGFTGSNGDRWAEGSYPLSSPDGGVVGPDSIAYPLDLECGTARQHTAEIEAWIYDAAGTAGQPVVIHLACTG
jgi:serine/threonine protein kinase